LVRYTLGTTADGDETLLWLRTRRRFVVLIPTNLDLPECIEDAFPNTVILLLSTTFLNSSFFVVVVVVVECC
jgi:hypothetical protein